MYIILKYYKINNNYIHNDLNEFKYAVFPKYKICIKIF